MGYSREGARVRGVDWVWHTLENATVANVQSTMVLVTVGDRAIGWYSTADVLLDGTLTVPDTEDAMETEHRHTAWYYDWTPGQLLSDDPEGNLCWLCDRCAQELGDWVSHASDDNLNEQPCWRCGGSG